MINFIPIYIFILGLIIGSFLNCLIWRLYKNETLGGRSYCPRCRAQIAWYDNLPLISFIFLWGRCRHCQQKISWQYPLVELTTAILFLLSFSSLEVTPLFAWQLARDWLLIVTLIIVFVYDWRWQMVPMTIVWPASALIFGFNLILGAPLVNIVFFGLLSAGFFLAQYLLTKKRGLGEGDIWLGLLLGIAFPGGKELFLIMLLAYISGAIVGGLWLFLSGLTGKAKIALGPFLAFGAIITLIWGEKIIGWYLGLF